MISGKKHAILSVIINILPDTLYETLGLKELEQVSGGNAWIPEQFGFYPRRTVGLIGRKSGIKRFGWKKHIVSFF